LFAGPNVEMNREREIPAYYASRSAKRVERFGLGSCGASVGRIA